MRRIADRELLDSDLRDRWDTSAGDVILHSVILLPSGVPTFTYLALPFSPTSDLRPLLYGGSSDVAGGPGSLPHKFEGGSEDPPAATGKRPASWNSLDRHEMMALEGLMARIGWVDFIGYCASLLV